MHVFTPRGVCSRAIRVELDGDAVSNVEFEGGCNGNLKAIAKVSRGMTVDQIAELWEGNTCGNRKTSCVDQLVCALREAQCTQAG
ncbi:MAG: TIGR03905 family TSCPD domain-containing protein [Gordonibacter sp.]|uniref:TIGR03905 family TSCPD domain-containing protein n=1 Tax=Gordonibacter sp. TaxID=1968902 RepID=UPI002FC6C077